MKRVLQVADTRDGIVLHLAEMLTVVEPEARDLQWTILDLGEAFAPDGSDLDVITMQREVGDSPTGLHVTFQELRQFAARLQQVVDGLFVGCSPGEEFPPRHGSDAAIIERAAIALAAFDSSFWLVSGPGEMLDRLSARFQRFTGRAPPDVKLSAWGR